VESSIDKVYTNGCVILNKKHFAWDLLNIEKPQGLWVAYGFHALILGVVGKGLWPIYTKWGLFKDGVSKKGKKTP
jgi:hypothetical protein